jgi:hypothetical protein
MILPTGQIMFTSTNPAFSNLVSIYTPAPGLGSRFAKPIVTSSGNFLRSPSKNNVIYGYRLNGITQNNAYGDDNQADTDYPLVILVNVGTGNIYFNPTHDESTHSISAIKPMLTYFDIPATVPSGLYELYVIANGIRSDPLVVTVKHLGDAGID